MLRELGYDAVSAREVGLNRAPDQHLIEFALKEDRVLATLDSDHHQIIATSNLAGPSVILIRVQGPSAEHASTLIHAVCQRYDRQLAQGCLVSCDNEGMRIRLLPI